MLIMGTLSRLWYFICEPCFFESGRIGFVWVRRVWNNSADPKSRQIWGAFRHTISQRKRWTASGNSQTNFCCLWQLYKSAKCDEVVPWILRRKDWCSRRTKERCKNKSWRGSKSRRQTSMTRGYRSWFQDLINFWTMPATILKNKIMYRQFIHSVAFVN